jgi:hypothetical protein
MRSYIDQYKKNYNLKIDPPNPSTRKNHKDYVNICCTRYTYKKFSHKIIKLYIDTIGNDLKKKNENYVRIVTVTYQISRKKHEVLK